MTCRAEYVEIGEVIYIEYREQNIEYSEEYIEVEHHFFLDCTFYTEIRATYMYMTIRNIFQLF